MGTELVYRAAFLAATIVRDLTRAAAAVWGAADTLERLRRENTHLTDQLAVERRIVSKLRELLDQVTRESPGEAYLLQAEALLRRLVVENEDGEASVGDVVEALLEARALVKDADHA